jgi:hypothetical protein
MPTNAWCTVCKCELPVNKFGHTLKVWRRAHAEGSKHRMALVSHSTRLQVEPLPDTYLYNAARAGKRQKRQALALALGVVATRLRAAHGSVEEARAAWASAADAQLQKLDAPWLETALRMPAREAFALKEMRATQSGHDHELLRLLFERLGWA